LDSPSRINRKKRILKKTEPKLTHKVLARAQYGLFSKGCTPPSVSVGDVLCN
jgi:hypothetical protein